MGILLRGGNVFLGKDALEPADILIEGSRIRDVSPRIESEIAETIDVAGKAVLPGLIDAHAILTLRQTYGPVLAVVRDLPDPYLFLRGVSTAMHYLKQGITTARDLAAKHDLNIMLRDAIKSGLVPGPRLFAAGAPIGATGAYVWWVAEEADGAEGFRQAARTRLKKGADLIKLFVSEEGPIAKPVVSERSSAGTQAAVEQSREIATFEEIAAAVEVAHGRRRKVAVHASGVEAMSRAINAGVDTIEHGIFLNKELATQMAERGIALIPTMSTYRQNATDRWGRWAAGDHEVIKNLIESHQACVQIAIEAGVRIGVGMDGFGDMIEELELLVECGMSTAQALTAVTRENAAILGIDDLIGELRPGMQADVIVVDGNPLEDLTTLGQVEYVIQGGVLRKPAEIVLPTGDESPAFNIASVLSLR